MHDKGADENIEEGKLNGTKYPEKMLSFSEDLLVPTERDGSKIISLIPQSTYIRNEQHYKKNKRRCRLFAKYDNSKDLDDSDGQNSFTTYKAMPELKDPRQFRWKNHICKTVLG